MGNRLNLTNSKLSFIHVGLPLDHPSIPIEIRKEASVQLPLLIDRMRAEGYGYELVFASPEGGMEVDPGFFVDFHDRPDGPARAHEVRLQGGDCTTEIFQ